MSDLDTKNHHLMVDICDLILEYASQFPFPKDIKAKAELDKLSVVDVDFSRLSVINKPAVHFSASKEPSCSNSVQQNSIPEEKLKISANNQVVCKRVKSHIIFSSTFTNNTSETQTHHLHTERRTTASCRVSVHKSVTKDGSMALQISPPGGMFQATAGFHKEVNLDKEREKTVEEELVWSLDTEVIVPAGYKTQADLIITEDEYQGHFRVETIFEGRIVVHIRDRKDGSVIYNVVVRDLNKVFPSKHGFQPVPNQPGAVSFISEGNVHCQFGIAQQVQLHQEALKV